MTHARSGEASWRQIKCVDFLGQSDTTVLPLISSHASTINPEIFTGGYVWVVLTSHRPSDLLHRIHCAAWSVGH